MWLSRSIGRASPRPAAVVVETLESRVQLSVALPLLAPPAANPPAAAALHGARRAAPTGVRQTGTFAAKEIVESSGVIASRKYSGIYYTHNDSGNASVLFAIRADGTLVGRYPLNVATRDWEDIAIDDAGQIYVADTGDNKQKRDFVTVHRLAEPAPGRAGKVTDKPIAVDRAWNLRFPTGPENCEALFISGRSGYVITKRKDGGNATLYRFPLRSSSRVQTLQKVTNLAITRPVTGADLSPDGKRLAITSTGALYVYNLAAPGDVASAGRLKPQSFALPATKVEGVTFRPDGGLFMTAESREVYELAASAIK